MLITNLIRLKILSHFLWAMIFVFPAGTRDVIMLNRERVSEITAEGKSARGSVSLASSGACNKEKKFGDNSE